MDEDARLYQDQLHQANQDRMKRVEDKLDELLDKVAPLRILTKQWASVEKRVGILEEEQWFRKGVLATLAFISSVAGAALFKGIDALIHRFLTK